MRILNTTVGSSADDIGSDVYGSTMHVFGEEVNRETLLGAGSDPENQEANLKDWLVEEWKRKSEMIRDLREI